MTYSARESGARTGEPIELYEFRYGVITRRVTSHDVDTVVNGFTYTSAQISNNGPSRTEELNKSPLKITVDKDDATAILFISDLRDDVVSVTLKKVHRGDNDPVVLWMGRITSTAWSGNVAELECESVITSLRRTGLRRKYSVVCPHTLYSVGCNVSKASFLLVGAVSVVNANVLTVPAAATKPDGYFDGGVFEWEGDEGVSYARTITNHVGTQLTVFTSVRGLTAGEVISMYPGCPRTLAVCDSRFANSDNHGGFSHMPDVSPFGGTTIY